jgi:LacI family gluconate utilization system Gnt-I transcriptional repressor
MLDAPRDTRRGETKARRGHGGVTLADVAKIARVSPITVSRVLSNPRLVAAQTAAQVKGVIARTGYVPNRLAGGLASSKTRLVTAIVPTMANQVFAKTVEAFREELLTAGYQLMVGLSGYGDSQEDNLLNAVISRRPDGILLTGVVHSPMLRRQLASARIPVIETWDLTPTPIDMLVGFSHEKVGRAVAEHLIGTGRRQLALILADDQRAHVRRQGFTEVVAARKRKLAACEVVPAPSTVRAGRESLSRILAAHPEVDAVFCSSDLLALGVLLEATARGIRVPDELAVMGFCNLSFAADTHPSLTTVEIDGDAIGRKAARLLLDRIEGGDVEGPLRSRIVDVGFRILQRESA